MPTPVWSGASSNQSPQASQINQFLTAHPMTVVYTGAEKDNQSTAGAGGVASNSTYLAQSFTAGSTYTSGRVVITIALTGTPNPLVVSLQSDSAGAPSGTNLAGPVSVPSSFVPGSATAISVPLSASIASGTKYWIVTNAVGDVSDLYTWSKSNQASGASTSPNGTTWTAQAYGLLFQVWDNTVIQPIVHTFADSGARWTTESFNANGSISALNEYTVAQTANAPVSSVAAFSANNGLPASIATSTTNAPWQAAHAGLLGQADAIEGSGQLNQFLTTHPGTQVYGGNVVVSPNGTGGGFGGSTLPFASWPLSGFDVDQEFTLTGTSIGRVSIPAVPIGNGADLIVSLCTDNSGNPGTVITRTRIPASWITQLSAVTAVGNPADVTRPVLNPSNNPLAVAQFNSWRMAPFTNKQWPFPSATANGSAPPCSAFYGNYLIFIGGVDGSHTPVANVYTAFCDTLGNVSLSVPQGNFPTITDGSGKCIVTTDATSGTPVIVQAGGSPVYLGSQVATVYTAEFDPVAGVINSWSQQQSLPYTVANQGTAASPGYVYMIGGSISGTVTNSVIYAKVQNVQLQSWTTTTPLPQALQLPYCCVSNGFLFVMGGVNAALTTEYSTCYYAPINADGSLGDWQTGPTFPGPGDNLDTNSFGGSLGVITGVGGSGSGNVNMSAVTPNGMDFTWNNESGGGGGTYQCYVPINNVSLQYYGIGVFGSYNTMTFTMLPNISVPLPATGLTNGGSYHILLQSPTNDPNNYLQLAIDAGPVLPGGHHMSTSTKNAYTWTSRFFSVPATVWDNSNSNPNAYGSIGNNQVIHTWEDSGARVTTLVRATTPDQRLIGICEATSSPTVLNSNSGFETGVSPWTGSNGTVTQSNAQAFEGLYSMLLTPTGGFSTAAALSEKVVCVPGVNYTVKVRAYSPGGYSNVDTQVNWYTAGGTFLSSSFTAFNVPAATWTDISSSFTAPLNAGLAQICLQEAGSPTSGNTIYFDNAWIYETSGGPQASSVLQVNYAGTWPGTKLWPPTGTTQLA